MSKYWIQKAIKHRGSLRRTAGVKKGVKIPYSVLVRLAKRPGVTGRRARLAKTLRKLSRRRKNRK